MSVESPERTAYVNHLPYPLRFQRRETLGTPSTLSVAEFTGNYPEETNLEWVSRSDYYNLSLLMPHPVGYDGSTMIAATHQAQQRMKGIFDVTPLVDVTELVGVPGLTVFAKDETGRLTGSYKERGAFIGVSQLDPVLAKTDGVAAVSAGNHAAAVGLACSLYGYPFQAWMPESAPQPKQDILRSLGFEPKLAGEFYSETAAFAKEYYEQNGRPQEVHPFNNRYVVIGQSTMAAEGMSQFPGRVDYHFMGAGGGGGVSGVSRYARAVDPRSVTVAVEPEGSAALIQSLQAGQLVELDSVDSYVDAMAVRQVGDLTLRYAQQNVAAGVTVTNHEIAEATLDLHEFGIPVEPAGAVGLAGLRKVARTSRLRGNVLTYLTGRNIAPEKLAEMKRESAQK